MSLHLCRDLPTLSGAPSPGTNMYVTAIFLYHVLNYSFVQHRNFPLLSSSIEKGGLTVVTGSLQFASINTGSATGFQVSIPPASYVVTAGDVNRILALRSAAHPRHNSGLFRITAVTTASNQVTVDYRAASGTTAPPDDRLQWRVYESEVVVGLNLRSGSNSSGPLSGSSLRFGYGTWDAGPNAAFTSSASRVFLQSPDPSLWQVRLCLESDIDAREGAPVGFTMAPGFFTAIDPFENPGGRVLHGPLFFNSTSSNYRGMAVGLGPTVQPGGGWTTGSWRVSMWGDDETGTFIIANRSSTSLMSGWAAFGLPEDDHLLPGFPIPSDPMQRLFVIGSPRNQGSFNWNTDFFSPTQANPPPISCVTWSEAGYPVPGALASYADVFNQVVPFRRLTQGGASPFGNQVEIIDVEIMAGTRDCVFTPTFSAPTSSVFQFQPRRVGRFPFARQGIASYVTWSHSPDDPGSIGTGPSWLHTEDGIFLPWGGPSLVTGSVGSNVLVITGSVFDGAGVQFFLGNTPGSDPTGPVVVPPAVITFKDVDATRYRKTYSYYRQPTVSVGALKAGSNRSK